MLEIRLNVGKFTITSQYNGDYWYAFMSHINVYSGDCESLIDSLETLQQYLKEFRDEIIAYSDEKMIKRLQRNKKYFLNHPGMLDDLKKGIDEKIAFLRFQITV